MAQSRITYELFRRDTREPILTFLPLPRVPEAFDALENGLRLNDSPRLRLSAIEQRQDHGRGKQHGFFNHLTTPRCSLAAVISSVNVCIIVVG